MKTIYIHVSDLKSNKFPSFLLNFNCSKEWFGQKKNRSKEWKFSISMQILNA